MPKPNNIVSVERHSITHTLLVNRQELNDILLEGLNKLHPGKITGYDPAAEIVFHNTPQNGVVATIRVEAFLPLTEGNKNAS